MKRIKRRASAALVIAALVMLGVGVLFVRLVREGGEWAAFRANESVYTARGVLNCGTMTDRNGTVLAQAQNGDYHYAEDTALRIASVHAVGDYGGHIGTAALEAFADKLTGYNVIRGTTNPGGTVALSLDAELQKTALGALAGRNGAVLLMNYETGELLCMVSSPGWDPNEPPDESIDGLYLNRALSASYTPGSVFKLVTLAAALENIPDLYERTFMCYGACEVGGVEIRCTGFHREQTIEEALANSCNCAFAELALELGGDTLAQYAKQLGLTETQELDGIFVRAGSFDAVEWQSSDLAWSGIGQYTDLVTPFAMLRFTAAAANGGTLRSPTLLLGERNEKLRLIKPATAEALFAMMSYDVSYTYAEKLPLGKLPLCGKTGTAELGDGTTHAWFTGFLSGELPLAVTVVVERGGSGIGEAAPIAVTLLKKAVENDIS